MDVSPARLWELCASSLWTTRQLQAGPHCRLSLEEFQVFFRKWLSTPDVRAKLARKLRRASMEEGAPAAAQQRQFSRLRGPADGELVEDDDGLEASIDEMIELPEGGVPFQYAFAMHSTPAGGRNERECTPEETLVVELLQSCERLEGEKAELSRKINELVIEQDTTERRVFEVELDKRGLATLLEQETASRRRAEETLATREKQWRGVETESLDDDELSSLLARLETAVSKVRATQSERLKSQREGLAKDLTCPITGEVVKDPVVAADGAHVFLASLLLLRVRLDRIWSCCRAHVRACGDRTLVARPRHLAAHQRSARHEAARAEPAAEGDCDGSTRARSGGSWRDDGSSSADARQSHHGGSCGPSSDRICTLAVLDLQARTPRGQNGLFWQRPSSFTGLHSPVSRRCRC